MQETLAPEIATGLVLHRNKRGSLAIEINIPAGCSDGRQCRQRIWLSAEQAVRLAEQLLKAAETAPTPRVK